MIEQIPQNNSEQERLLETADVSVSPETGLAIVVIKPMALERRQQILKKLEDEGLYIVKTVSKKLPLKFVVGTMYKDLPPDIEEKTKEHFASGESEIVLVKGGKDMLEKMVNITGSDTNPNLCDKESIRYIFGEHLGRETMDGGVYYRNAIHRPENEKERREGLNDFESFM